MGSGGRSETATTTVERRRPQTKPDGGMRNSLKPSFYHQSSLHENNASFWTWDGLMWIVGMGQASCFSMIYFLAPSYMISAVGLIIFQRGSTVSLLYASPMIISALLPPIPMPFLFSLLKPMLQYFDSYEQIIEVTPINTIENLLTKKCNYILACQPHGVLSYNGILSGITAPPEIQGKIPTAVADIVLRTPILKHVMGVFGLISASKKSLLKTLSQKGVEGTCVLYVGGMAELFLSCEHEERLYLKNRKGFIKLSLQTGVDVIPVYLFGNTTVLSILKTGILATLSRKIGASLTYVWGKWYLPIPRNCKLLYVSGQPIGIPHIPDPTQQDIDKYHTMYCEQVERLFEKYKEKVPEYKHKKLHIV